MLGGQRQNKFEIVLVVRDGEGKSTGKKKSFSSDSSDKIFGFLDKSSRNKNKNRNKKNKRKRKNRRSKENIGPQKEQQQDAQENES